MRFLARLAVGLGLAGCATPPARDARPPAVAPAHLTVVNLTPFAWEITAVAPAGAALPAQPVPPHATAVMTLAGGDWILEQTRLGGDGGPALTRRVPVRLEAGQDYRWPLATLLSGADGESAAAPPEP